MFYTIIEVVVLALACCAASVRWLHALQRERYSLPAYQQWLRSNRERILMQNVLWSFLAAALKAYLPMLLSIFIPVEAVRVNIANWGVLALFTGLLGAMGWRDYRRPAKKPFAVTQRVQRLATVLFALCLAIGAVLVWVSPYFLYALSPLLVWLAARLIEPYERRLNAGFFKSAKKKLRARKDLITIGITGSFGKTGVKFILKELLGVKYNVLATPASFNTAMGVSRVVNEQLKPEHQVFIAEMGAIQVGEIKELVGLVRPRYGILTGIGPRHLNTFGSMENIASTKFELIEGLPKDGLAVFGCGDDYISRLYAMCPVDKCRIGPEGDAGAYMRAERVTYGTKGAGFELVCSDGETAYCRTRLLGGYNIRNILMAAALARKMGLTMEEIAEGLRRVNPIEHRLQLIAGDLNVIDDSLNEDPDSAFEAMRVISRMPGRRIVVTPGLNDGEKGADVNYALGTVMADSCDTAILVGRRPHTRSVMRGMLESGFARGNLRRADDMDDAYDLLDQVAENGDTVLFESRIPDYEEE